MDHAFQKTNLTVTRHADVLGRHQVNSCWAELLIEDGRNDANWVCGQAGTPDCTPVCELHSDPHIHPDFNEWWIVLEGKTRWQIGQYEPIVAEWGDIVMAPAGFSHDIHPWEGDQAVRLAVTHPKSNHDIKGIAPCRYITVDPGLAPPNLIHTPLSRLVEKYGTGETWKEVVVLDERNRALITHEMPGTENRRMWHPDMHKWWVVLGGRLEWSIGDEQPVVAGPGDVVFVESETPHEIRTVGDEPSIRVTITAPDIVHHYTGGSDEPPPNA